MDHILCFCQATDAQSSRGGFHASDEAISAEIFVKLTTESRNDIHQIFISSVISFRKFSVSVPARCSVEFTPMKEVARKRGKGTFTEAPK
jgi:hypothetical protein